MSGTGGAAVHEVVRLEAAALGRWCRGDPSGFLEVADEEVGYFDSFISARIDGREALTVYYDGLRGRVSAESWEILDPRVVEVGDVALLSFRFRSRGRDGTEMVWNATEAWRRRGSEWRIFHTHWSFAARGDGGAVG